MAAYVIVRVLEVRDTAWRTEYVPKTAALIEKNGGKFLVRGGAMESLEGSGKLPNIIVVLEFHSMEQAKVGTTIPLIHR